jgi:hypothetical protein
MEQNNRRMLWKKTQWSALLAERKKFKNAYFLFLSYSGELVGHREGRDAGDS